MAAKLRESLQSTDRCGTAATGEMEWWRWVASRVGRQPEHKGNTQELNTEGAPTYLSDDSWRRQSAHFGLGPQQNHTAKAPNNAVPVSDTGAVHPHMQLFRRAAGPSTCCRCARLRLSAAVSSSSKAWPRLRGAAALPSSKSLTYPTGTMQRA